MLTTIALVVSIVVIVLQMIVIFFISRNINKVRISEADRWWSRCCNPKATLYDLEQLEAVLKINKVSLKQIQNCSEKAFLSVKKYILVDEIKGILQNTEDINTHTYKKLQDILKENDLSLQDLDLNLSPEKTKTIFEMFRKKRTAQTENELKLEFQRMGLD